MGQPLVESKRDMNQFDIPAMGKDYLYQLRSPISLSTGISYRENEFINLYQLQEAMEEYWMIDVTIYSIDYLSQIASKTLIA